MGYGYSYPIFIRTIHFRLGEKSGRSPVVHAFLPGEDTNKTSHQISSNNKQYEIKNSTSFMNNAYTDFVISHSVGPNINTFLQDTHIEVATTTGPSLTTFYTLVGGQQDTSSVGPSVTAFYNDDSLLFSIGPSINSSGDYQEIKLINRFGHRNDQGTVRGFGDAQVQPTPSPFEVIEIPEALRAGEAFAVWLDAASIDSGMITTDLSDGVIGWRNKAPSGTSWSQTGIASQRPSFVSNSQNGLGGIDFDGVANSLFNESLSLASSSGEIFFVAKLTTLPTSSATTSIWGASTASDADKYLQLRPWFDNTTFTGAEISANNTAGVKTVNYDTALDSGTPYVFCFRSQGQGMPWEIEINGSGLTGSDREFAAHDGVWHGAIGGLNRIDIGSVTISDTTQNFWHGTLHEVVGYEAQQAGVARTGILNYLADRWNIPLAGSF